MEENDGENSPIYRKPHLNDARAMYALAEATGVLDLNSLYSYLLICDHYVDTSVVVDSGSTMAGFISAYFHPRHESTLFIWQVAVDASARGQGIAGTMIDHIISRFSEEELRYIVTTITPSNGPSDRLFRSVGQRYRASVEVTDHYTLEHFGSSEHEPEQLYRIGPLLRSKS